MRNRYVFLADIPAIAVAGLTAFLLRFDWLFITENSEVISYVTAAVVIKTTVFYMFGLYARYWRYASVRDLLDVTLATGVSSFAMATFVGLVLPVILQQFSRTVIVIDGVLTLLAIAGVRLSVRIISESSSTARDRQRLNQDEKSSTLTKKVLVVGAGDSGAMVVREMQRNTQLGMEPIGFLDDDPGKWGKSIYGIPVLGSLEWLTSDAGITKIDEVVIAMPTASGTVVRSVVEGCRALGLRSRTMPGVFELLDGQVSMNRLRHVEVDDLLRRPQVVSTPESNGYISDKVALVTGAGGSIGFELCRQVAYHRPRLLVMLGHGENSLFEAQDKLRNAFPDISLQVVVADIRDRHRLEHVFKKCKPSLVFHAAAHKHVPLMEANFEDAISNNVIGTHNLVEVALSSHVDRFVAISTDKSVSPNSIMGASKWMASAIVQDAAKRSGKSFVVVRFGNVLGSRGSIVPFFKAQIERGGPVTVTHPEMKRFFMTISEAVHLVLKAGGMGNGGELFVLNMGKPIRIMDLATDVIRFLGFTLEQIPIVITGTRPGEKLEELLWENDAVVESTENPEILKVTERWMSAKDLPQAVEALEQAAQVGDRSRVEAILCDWIPTFTPSAPEADQSDSNVHPFVVRSRSGGK